MGQQIKIKDTGLDKVGGSVTYSAVTYGIDNWIDLDGFTFRGEFTVNTTNNVATKTTINYFSGESLDFQSNEIAALQAPRFTLQGLVSAGDSTKIRAIVNLGRTMGIKRISGGMGLINALPEVATDTYNYVSVIVKNITFSEVVSNGEDKINFTIQLEQVN
jgi:hypothetical protein